MATHSSTLAGESNGQRSLVGYSPQGHRESDQTERLSTHSVHGAPPLNHCLYNSKLCCEKASKTV